MVPPSKPSLSDRILAESLCALERDGAAPVEDDALATAAGAQAAGGMEAKIIARAKATAAAGELFSWCRHYAATARWMVAVLLVLMMAIGAGAARAALGVSPEGRVNFFLALGTLLGVQTIALAIWLLLVFMRPSALASFSLGGLARWLVDVVLRRASRSPVQVAALEGAMTVHSSSRVLRWTLSSLSHAGWLAFNVGCVVTLLALLSARQYTFVWETTILSEQAYWPMVEALSTGPEAAGFRVPTEAQVAASQWTGDAATVELDEGSRRAWAGLLVGSIVVYGALPRFVLLLFSFWRLRAARRAYRLDLARPGFAILAARLAPQQQSLGVIDADDGGGGAHASRAASPSARPAGPPAIVGIEMDRPQRGSWPPQIPGLSLHDLGFLNDRGERQRVTHQLHTAAQEPAALVIACSLTSTPDRGVGSIIGQLRAAISRPAYVVLTGGQALRERGDGDALVRRVEDWRRLAMDAGIAGDNVIEMDLDHATDASLARLATLLQGQRAKATIGPRRLEGAFATIVQHAEKWKRTNTLPDHRAQTALHQDILRLYGSDVSSWRSLLGSSTSITELGADAARTLTSHASRAVQLLPAPLRIRPKWAIAGASAGAIGCVAAAMLVAPAAIGALPLWSAIGAAIAAALGNIVPVAKSAEATSQQDIGEAVRAAALSSLLLELQGRSEQMISRVLERVLVSPEIDEPEAIESAAQAGEWLDLVRHHFDLALAQEARA